MQTVYGQHDGRVERTEQTSDWLGAAPVTADGRPLPTVEGLSEKTIIAVMAVVETIRASLGNGVQTFVTEQNPAARQFIKGMLTDEERTHVTFDPDDSGEEFAVLVTPPRKKPRRDIVRRNK